jgi:hypothetical protein
MAGFKEPALCVSDDTRRDYFGQELTVLPLLRLL